MLTFDDARNIEQFIKQRYAAMKEEYPDLDILVLDIFQYPAFMNMMRAHIEHCEQMQLGFVEGTSYSENMDAVVEKKKMIQLLEWAENHTEHVSCSSFFEEADDSTLTAYDRYLIPMPEDWKDNTVSLIKGASCLLQDVAFAKSEG